LTDHRVDDEQNLVWVGCLGDVAGLLHQLFVNAEATRGVNDYNAVLLLGGVLDRVFCDCYWVTYPVTRLWSENVYAGALTNNLQLVYGIRALKVGGN
jgi:hypothetical protein